MQTSNRNLWIALVVVAIIAIGGCFYPQVQKAVSHIGLAGETNYNTLGVTGLKVGASCGDSFGSSTAAGCRPTAHLIVGTCALLGLDVSQAASTTVPYDCAVTGVTSSDNVIASFSTTTAVSVGWAGQPSWLISGAKASSTAGFITIGLTNLSGAAKVPSATNIGSTTQYVIFQ